MVITRTGPSPAAPCCERYGLPQVRTYIAPSQLRTLVDPPWPLKRMAKGRLRSAFLDYHLPKLHEEWDHHPGILQPLNEQRRKLGISPLESTAPLERNVDRFIGFFPDWFSPPAPDWHSIDLVGFPAPDETGSLAS